MKRKELIRHLTAHGCELLREGGRHSIWWKPADRRKSSVPRHSEVSDVLAAKICRDLDIPRP
ncbi:MAG: type II toxin-antitoxin system HicA family toxin [Verrucomicrobiota bacterium]